MLVATNDQFYSFVTDSYLLEARPGLVTPGLSGRSLPPDTSLLAVRFMFN